MKSFVRLPALIGALLITLLGTRALAQSYPPAWNSTATYAVGDLTQTGGNEYRCIQAGKDESPLSAYTYWEAETIRNSINLSVGVQMPYPTLTAAWNHILNARIAPSATVHILISTKYAAFNESFPSVFSLDHPFGSQISIVGDNPQHIDLSFASSNAISIDTGHVFGTLSNVTVTGSGPYTGIYATDGAQIQKLDNVYVMTFNVGLLAEGNGTINATKTVNVSNYTFAGVQADTGGKVSLAQGFTLAGPGVNSKATGLFAYENGTIIARGIDVYFNFEDFVADNRGYIVADGSTATDSQTGVLCEYGGYVSFEDGQLANTIDVNCTIDSFVDIQGASYNAVDVTSGDGSYVLK